MSEPLQFNTPVIDAEGNIMTLFDLAHESRVKIKLLWETSKDAEVFSSEALTDVEGFTHLLVVTQSTPEGEEEPVTKICIIETSDDPADLDDDPIKIYAIDLSSIL